jgi:hypothetical protein
MEMMIVEAGVARAGQSQDALTYGGRRARRGGGGRGWRMPEPLRCPADSAI